MSTYPDKLTEQLEIKEEISGGIFFQYVNSIALVLAGFIFYIYIIHFYSSELVGTVALLLAITSLLNIFFSLGLGYGLQHYISYQMGRKEYGKIREMITKFLLIGLSLGVLSLLALYLSSPIFAMLFFHTFKPNLALLYYYMFWRLHKSLDFSVYVCSNNTQYPKRPKIDHKPRHIGTSVKNVVIH